MISRRNVRIKVMQVLYAAGKASTLPRALRHYEELIEQAYTLYLYNLLVYVKTTGFSVKDAAIRSAKHLPSQVDEQFTPRLFNNPLTHSLSHNLPFIRACKRRGLYERLNDDTLRLLYTEFAKQEVYESYILASDPGESAHRAILLEMYRFISKTEHFEEDMEENFANWRDDKSLVFGATKRTIKALPAPEDFLDQFQPEKEATDDFGKTLLTTVWEKDREYLDLIEPVLKNWDAERLALIDRILLKMAICELTTFPTIPIKVTINEYVEIAKKYSTEKSKEFVNGILDRMMKKLQSEGLIQKKGRGLQDQS